MSGIVGHSTYAILGLETAAARRIPIAPLLNRHFSSYLAGAYLGSDIQIVPAYTCVDTGRHIGCCNMVFDKCPETGGPVAPWRLRHEGQEYSGAAIHALFYGRAHLIFGYTKDDAALAIPWDHAVDYFAAVVDDTIDLFPPSERTLAYVFGWMVHVLTDSLIKSVLPGIELHLIDGVYTPRNRPVQDLYCFHEVGVKKRRLKWPAVLHDLSSTPVEPVQFHYMRVGKPRGKLGRLFNAGWEERPARRSLLEAVLRENRRYTHHHADDEIQAVRLNPDVSAEVRAKTGLNTYAEAMAAAGAAGYAEVLVTMGNRVADLFAAVVARCPRAV